LRIRFGGRERPKDFKIDKTSVGFIMTFKREKP
jgi:hypothetical protein